MFLGRPYLLLLLLAVMALSTASCADVDYRPDTRKCDGNVFYWCYRYEWRKTECREAAPYCDARKSCLARPDNTGPTDGGGETTGGEDASASCTTGEQTCIGNNLYKCMDASWRIITCPDEMPVCDEEQGCIETP